MRKKLDANDERYIYQKGGKRSSRVGQAVWDIMTQDQEDYSCEEIIDAFGPDYVKEFNDVVEKNKHRLESPFYVFVITKKEMWAVNIIRNIFQARQSAPNATDMIIKYKHPTKTLYKVNTNTGDVSIIWSIPGFEECKAIAKHPDSFDPTLVDWINRAYEGYFDDKSSQ